MILKVKLRSNGIEFRRGLSGGGNQMRQPSLSQLIQTFQTFQILNIFIISLGILETIQESKKKNLILF